MSSLVIPLSGIFMASEMLVAGSANAATAETAQYGMGGRMQMLPSNFLFAGPLTSFSSPPCETCAGLDAGPQNTRDHELFAITTAAQFPFALGGLTTPPLVVSPADLSDHGATIDVATADKADFRVVAPLRTTWMPAKLDGGASRHLRALRSEKRPGLSQVDRDGGLTATLLPTAYNDKASPLNRGWQFDYKAASAPYPPKFASGGRTTAPEEQQYTYDLHPARTRVPDQTRAPFPQGQVVTRVYQLENWVTPSLNEDCTQHSKLEVKGHRCVASQEGPFPSTVASNFKERLVKDGALGPAHQADRRTFVRTGITQSIEGTVRADAARFHSASQEPFFANSITTNSRDRDESVTSAPRLSDVFDGLEEVLSRPIVDANGLYTDSSEIFETNPMAIDDDTRPETDVGDPFANLESVSDDELAEQRGGLNWQGMQISFGAELLTWLNGELMLRTVLMWTPHGASITEHVHPDLRPAQAHALTAGALAGGEMRMSIGDNTLYLANGGQTALAHAVTEDGIQNFLFNTADFVQATQEVNANIDLKGYDQFASALLQTQIAENLSAAIATAMTVGSR